MKVEVRIIERISNKTGNPYKALELTFPNGYKKVVLCENSELFMVEQIINQLQK